jgi:riboflavin kinase/FMN adenylyltransferase
MKEIIKDYNNINPGNKTTFALGYFDGIHLGHQELLKKVKEISSNDNTLSGIFTFTEHPLHFILPEYVPELLTTNIEKSCLVQKYKFDYNIFQKIDDHFMKMTAEDFIVNVLVKRLNIKNIVIGFNYHFGYKGKGNAEVLKKYEEKYGFKTYIIPPISIEDNIVSSTLIRGMIKEGNMEDVSRYLGRNFSVRGNVVSGKKLGRQINIATANIEIDENKIMPHTGVYVTKTEVNGNMYESVTNVGYNPTFTNHPFSVETHILDFEKEIYGKLIKVEFLHKLRDEKRFNDIDELVQQMEIDIKKTKKYHKKLI